jgi:hypothetical protein
MKVVNTTSCCPVCKKILPAKKITEGNSVFLERECPEHGNFKVLVSKDSKRFFDKRFDSPGKKVYDLQTKKEKGCPEDCGLCPDHKQHMCSSLIEITGRCDLRCPVCYYADFETPDISLEEFKSRLEVLMKTENGHLDVLQLSGGEPLLHGKFIEILKYAAAQDINRVLINTNGRTLLKNEEIYQAVKELKDRTEIYLQFDGFDKDSNIKLRGNDLLDEKLALIEKLGVDDIKISLAVTVMESNLKEVKNIIKFACEKANITGITFQRFAMVGDGSKVDYKSVLQEDIIHAAASSGLLKYKDIVPLPCSHENCTSISFLFVADGQVHSMADFIDYEKHQAVIQNKIGFESTILNYLRDNALCGPENCCSWITNSLPIVKKLREFTTGKGSNYKNMKMLRILVKNFMDAYTFDAERAKKCCFGISTGKGRIMPFCVNNIFNRGRENAL